ncbi:MAG: insulinase family protein [Planctomycetota bacterium]|nr:insulinase family protein [Planctomycetota bacterium]
MVRHAVLAALLTALASACGAVDAVSPAIPEQYGREPPGPSYDPPPLEVGGHVFHRRTLGNGLQALAARDAEAETITVYVVYAVGRRMEGPLTSGLAHLVEHAMYAGTLLLGPGEHDALIVQLGGESNAYTRTDYTVYYDHGLPPAALERVLAMEAVRMRGLTFDEDAFLDERFRLEQEEERTADESTRRQELVESVVFRAQTYGVGVPDDEGHTRAPGIDVEAARAFYDAWYHPDRAAVVVTGAIDPDGALAAVEQAFGSLPPGPPAPDFPREPEAALGGEARFASSLSRDRVTLAWAGPALDEAEGGYRDRIALYALAVALSKRRSPDGSAVEAVMGPGVDRDLFRISATGADADATLQAILDSIHDEEGLTDAALATALQDELDAFARLDLHDTRPYFSLGAMVGALAANGAADHAARYDDVIRALTPEDVRAIARRWLPADRAWKVRFIGAEGTGAEQDELPDDRRELQGLAVDLAESGDHRRSITAYEKLLGMDQSDMNTVILLYSIAEQRKVLGDLAGAKRDLEAALAVVDYPAVRDLLEQVEEMMEGGGLTIRRVEPPEPADPVREIPIVAASGHAVVGVEGAAPGFAAEADAILAEIEEWRGLSFKSDLVIEFVERGDEEQKLAGWYEPETDRLVVVETERERFGRGTLLHEMVHALQDQHFDLARLHAEASALGPDAERAVEALIEGEAMLAVSELMDYDFEQHATIPAEGELDEERFRKVFHYGAGLRFVRALREAGGWEQVSLAFREPPTSTMAIFHPDRHLAGVVYDTEGSGPLGNEHVGEYGLQLLLSRSEASRSDAVRLAGRLAGDALVGDEGAYTWMLRFHDELGARAFLDAVPLAGLDGAQLAGRDVLVELEEHPLGRPEGD